jgi:1-aminocyclopropane-1-carboxylate deaminase
LKSIIQNIPIKNKDIALSIKREDLIHPFISGNKYRKLKYNLLQAKTEKQTTLLTFGGAFSNHIAAVAAAGKEYDLKTIGIIRGEELETKIEENPTLKSAQECGMTLKFVSRPQYAEKESPKFINDLKQQFGSFYLLPEGGTNALAVKGCTEILTAEDAVFDYICTAVGTGGTICGLANGAFENQQILGFPVLKGDFLDDGIRRFAIRENWKLVTDYHFGGYGKITRELIGFINGFYHKTRIPLDPVYTGKLLFGVMDLIEKDFFPAGSKILVIHTGGIQGIEGMNIVLKNKKLPLIEIND